MASLSPQAKEKIQAILSEATESKRIPGLFFGAANANEELYLAHAGYRVFNDPSSGPITNESVFWICSMTKLIISLATLQLIERGKLELDTRASSILPELASPVIVDGKFGQENPKFKPADGEITIRYLLNHSSGFSYLADERDIPYDLPLPYTSSHNKDNPIPYFYSLIKGSFPTLPLKFEPGSSFEYGWGLDTLGFIVETISGQTLEEYFKQYIFSPLGITSASFYLTPELRRNAVPLSFRREDRDIVPWSGQVRLIEQDPQNVHLHLGGIGIYSSLKDYLTLLQHLLQIQAGSASNPILSVNSVDSLFQPTLSKGGEKAINEKLQGKDLQWSTGLCLNTTDWPGRRRKGSGCWYGWAGTYYLVDPTTGVALVFGSQIIPTRDPEITKLWAEVEEAFYGGLTA